MANHNERAILRATELAHFDPITVSLHFAGSECGTARLPSPADKTSDSAKEWDGTVEGIPTSILAHELAHLFLATTTGSGVRQFQLLVKCLHYNLELIRCLAKENSGAVRAPVAQRYEWANLKEASEDEVSIFAYERKSEWVPQLVFAGVNNPPGYPIVHSTATAIRESIRATEELLLLEGGPNLLANEQVLGNVALPSGELIPWLSAVTNLMPLGESLTKTFGTLSGSIRLAADMAPITRQATSVMLGTNHLHEGFGVAVELLQRRFTGEEGPKAGPSGPVELDPSLRSHSDPYFLAHYAYSAIVGAASSASQLSDLSLEECCLLIDLAMMCDPAVVQHSGLDTAGLTDLTAPVRLGGPVPSSLEWSTFEVFLRFCWALASSLGEIPRFDVGWRDEDVAAFQDAILRATGSPLNIALLSDAALTFFEDSFATPTRWSPELWEIIERIYRGNLAIRRDVLKGASPLLWLMTPREDLERLLQALDPVVSIGRAGGIGELERLLHFQQSVDVAAALVYGNGPCGLHVSQPRRCGLPVKRMCSQLPTSSPQTPACTRDVEYRVYLRSVGVSEVSWT